MRSEDTDGFTKSITHVKSMKVRKSTSELWRTTVFAVTTRMRKTRRDGMGKANEQSTNTHIT